MAVGVLRVLLKWIRMMSEELLVELSEIAEPGAKGFEVELATGDQYALFVVRKDGGVHAYRNRCPHTGAPLEWTPDQFLDLDNSFVQCAMHGALFRVSDGYCLRGPCAGDSLMALPLKRDGDRVIIDVSSMADSQ